MPTIALSDRGKAHLAMLPPIFRDDPMIQLVQEVGARAIQRLEDAKETLLAEIYPQTSTHLLAIDEIFAGLPVNSSTLTTQQRRDVILSYLQKITYGATGAEWEVLMARFFGSGGWSYVEDHDDYTVNVSIPFGEQSDYAYISELLARAITPANLVVNVSYSSGFILNESRLGDVL